MREESKPSLYIYENIRETNCYVLVCAFCRKTIGFFTTNDLVKDEGWQIQCTECAKLV